MARGQIKHGFRTSNVVNTLASRDAGDADGVRLGLGVERQIDGHVRLGLEYLYSHLDDGGYTVRAQGPAPAANPFILANASGADMRRSQDDL